MIYLFVIIEFESSDSVGERCIFETIPCSSLDNPWPCCSKASPATKSVHSDDLPADGAICSEFAALGLRNLRNFGRSRTPSRTNGARCTMGQYRSPLIARIIRDHGDLNAGCFWSPARKKSKNGFWRSLMASPTDSIGSKLCDEHC